MNTSSCSWVLAASVLTAISTANAQSQPASRPSTAPATAVVIPTEGPIEWKLTVDAFAKAVNMASTRKPRILVFEINSPGGVVDYTWDMVSQFKSKREVTTVAWVNGKLNGAFSSGAIFALGCDKIYIAQGQAIGAAVPYALDDAGVPRDVTLKWRSAWHAQVRALCEMKHRPWPVVYALLSTSAGLYRMKTDTGYEYVNYDRIRPLLKPELVTQMDVVVKAEKEETEDQFSGHMNTRVTRSVSFSEGMPPGVEVICPVGDVLTLTSEEAVRCGLCDGIADSMEQILQSQGAPVDAPSVVLADPFKASNQEMDNAVKAYLASMAAVGGSVRAGTAGLGSSGRRVYFAAPTVKTGKLLAEYRKLQSLMRRYPDLVTNPETRAEVDAAITTIQADLQQQKAAQERARQEQVQRRGTPNLGAPPPVMPGPIYRPAR